MRKLLYLHLVILVLIFLRFPTVSTAQISTPISCGTSLEGHFTRQEETQVYEIQLEAGSRLIAYVEKADQFGELKLKIGIFTANGDVVVDFERYNYRLFKVASTPTLRSGGTFFIHVRGLAPGTYRLYSDCVESDGTVISAGNITNAASCGSIIANTFSQAQSREEAAHLYFINLPSVDNLTASVEVADSRSDLILNIALYDPVGNVIHNFRRYNYVKMDTAEAEFPSDEGIYVVAVLGHTSAPSNDYNLFISCILNDGPRINPGDAAPDPQPTQQVVTSPELPANFVGFPGLAPVDFSSGIEIPLQVGQAQPAPVGADVILYTYEATADEVRSFSITRMSGNISVGVTVIKRDTNEIIFFGGMPSGDNLRVDLKFPSGGIYLIGLFRVETAEHSGTSGAVQILLE